MGTIAEVVLLMGSTDPGSLTFAPMPDEGDILVGGALVAEATVCGAMRLDDGRRFAAGPASMTADLDPLVERAARHVLSLDPSLQHENNTERWAAAVTFPIDAVDEVVERLRSAGAIRTEEHKRFGRKATTVDLADRVAVERILTPMRSVMLDDRPPQPALAVSMLVLSALSVLEGWFDLSRSDRKHFRSRADALFTAWHWQGDDGTPSIPVAGIDDATRRMLGDLTVEFVSAYYLGVGAKISSEINNPSFFRSRG